MKGKYLFLFLLFPLGTKAQNFGGNPASIKWRQINTAQSRIIFPKELDSQANRVSNLINLLNTHTLYSIGDTMRKWDVILLNQTTDANAFVRLAPVISELYMIPPQNNFVNGSIRWDDNLVIHEDRHMQQFSNFNKGFTKVFSFLLGQQGQLLANGITIPDYFFEGDAVWQETLVSRQGRGRMPWFFNGFRSIWLSNRNYSWMKLRSGSMRHYTPDHYELGYQLVAYGYENYGYDFWKKVTGDAVRFKRLFYSFNKSVEKYSGKSYRQFRNDALEYFKEETLSPELDSLNYITAVEKNNVIDYFYPQFVNEDTLVVSKQSYKELNSFYFLVNGKEKKIRLKDYATDDYFSYKNGKIVYAAYKSDPRRANRNYSIIQLLDVHTKKQKQLTHNAKYFSPDINAKGTEVIAVLVNPDGSNFLHRLNASTGKLIKELPNPDNFFFTQTKYIDNGYAVSAVRNPAGQMALVKVNLTNGITEQLTNFTYSVLGYPEVTGGKVYFSMTDNYPNKNKLKPVDRIFAVDLGTKKLYRVTKNINGIYHPAVNVNGELLFTSFTSDGSRLVKANIDSIHFQEITTNEYSDLENIPAANALQKKNAGILYRLENKETPVTRYKKSMQIFNFHSRRPVAADPEYGFTFYSDNVLSNFSNSLNYIYNRNERSHTIGYSAAFAGWFPYLSIGAEYSINRNIDTALNRSINFNSAKISAGISIPLVFIRGRTFKYLNFGAAYNIEQLPYTGIGKNIFSNNGLKYTNAFISFNNQSRQAKQYINPRWAQLINITTRNSYNFYKSRKLVSSGSLYFPGIFPTHSLVFNGAYQARDTVPDFFSNTFSYSRGYEALNTRRMYKAGINYGFPLFYPDWGFGNIVFFQRARANIFYDHTSSKARVNGILQNIINRSVGAELYFDGKIWNALSAGIGIRYSHFLDTDLFNPGASGRWEIMLPVDLIPN